MDRVSQKEALKEKLQVILNFENEEDEIVAYFEGHFEEKEVAAICDFEINRNCNDNFNKKQNNSLRRMVHFVAKNIQADTATFCNILSDLSDSRRISYLTMEISFNDASQLKNSRGKNILMDIGWKISIRPLTLLDLRLESCQIDDTSFIILIENLNFTEMLYLKFFLVDNQKMSDLALIKFKKHIILKGRKLKSLEMIFCEKTKITGDGINQFLQGFEDWCVQTLSLTLGRKEHKLQKVPNVQKKGQEEEQKLNNSQMSTWDKSIEGANSLVAYNKQAERPSINYNGRSSNGNSSPSLDENEPEIIEPQFLLSNETSAIISNNYQEMNGLNSSIGDHQYCNLANQNGESY